MFNLYLVVNIHQDTNVLKCKKKRLGHLNHIKKRTPSITSNTNEIIPNNLDINKINDTQLQVAVLAKLIVPEKIMPDDSGKTNYLFYSLFNFFKHY